MRSEFKKYLDSHSLNIPADDQFPYFFIGDDAFPISTSLLKPYKETKLLLYKENFNKLLSGARVVIENAFGVLVSRWRVLAKKMDLLPENAKKVTMACIVMHNLLIERVIAIVELLRLR